MKRLLPLKIEDKTNKLKTINQVLKYLILAVLFLVIVLLLAFNFSLYYKPDFKKNNINQVTYNLDVYNQLKHLQGELRQGAGKDMQSIFPEGLIFINALYGLSWSTLIANQPKESAVYLEGVKEISWAITAIEHPSSKAIFPEDLPLRYGAFYRGWTNYLLGKKLQLQGEEERDEVEVRKFIYTCQEISQAIITNESPYLESYKGQKWPADGIIAVSSLALYDNIYKTGLYKEQLEGWLDKVKSNLDHKTGLIPHSVEAYNDKPIEGARGSSQSLILVFLKDIDQSFSEEQFKKYKTHFLDSRLGMPGIREYPKGQLGFGDIDSGPVILGIGGAASIVGQRTMGLYGDWETFKGLRNCIESFGVGMTFKSKKKYIFGLLPMADAFIAWSNSIEQSEIKVKQRTNWRIKAQMVSFVLLLFSFYLINKIRIQRFSN